MLRTIPIKLIVSQEETARLQALQEEYAAACNLIVPQVIANRCWNRFALHQLAYTQVRSTTKLGSQMTCNALFTVCKAYQSQKTLGRILPGGPIPNIAFNKASVHFDKKTYSILPSGILSLYTLDKRIKVSLCLGG